MHYFPIITTFLSSHANQGFPKWKPNSNLKPPSKKLETWNDLTIFSLLLNITIRIATLSPDWRCALNLALICPLVHHYSTPNLITHQNWFPLSWIRSRASRLLFMMDSHTTSWNIMGIHDRMLSCLPPSETKMDLPLKWNTRFCLMEKLGQNYIWPTRHYFAKRENWIRELSCK